LAGFEVLEPRVRPERCEGHGGDDGVAPEQQSGLEDQGALVGEELLPPLVEYELGEDDVDDVVVVGGVEAVEVVEVAERGLGEVPVRDSSSPVVGGGADLVGRRSRGEGPDDIRDAGDLVQEVVVGSECRVLDGVLDGHDHEPGAKKGRPAGAGRPFFIA